ncbi:MULTISPECIES: glycosyltransferase family 61 protein [Commensalibacter]|uniref:Glycosyltransferase 61 catalytic domain-containing protein n=2 Tax=Commensalibacter TaxID=1079922 RepID=W7DWG3_9PROT|nr:MULTISPECIES: glycosyltransferase 61 family protein [Commensalibacter]EUK19420.1 hypothetical protein COMX_06700 [Commensalibacter papalotli (ex Servin-Garciduenas et al. 2014)]CAI3935169.1 unnamed protein product [Commensalibacter papalotli (ex Botero et al. 2024)]CAI3951303.1 unnamed protein product [Commensalibacter papalotli (ex Botero et al. 2024)]
MQHYSIAKIEDLFVKIEQEDLLNKEGYAEIMMQGEALLPDLHYAYGTREQIPIQRPIGMPAQSPGIPKSITYPSMTITHIKNAILLPGGIIIAQNKILIDSFASNWDTTYHNFLKKINNTCWGVENASPNKTIQHPVFFCDYQHSNFYGHFMLDSLTRLWGLFYLKNFYNLNNIHIFQTFNNQYIKEYLNLYNINDQEIHTLAEPLLVEDLYVATKSLQIQEYCSPALPLCWNTLKRPTANNHKARLYISRRTQEKRRLQEEDKIEEFFAAHNYIIIYPETLSVSQQIILFSNASHIIGTSGTNMFGIAFSPPDCKIMILASEVFVHYSEFFLRYGYVEKIILLTGKSEAHTNPDYAGNINAPWSIDFEKLKEMSLTFNFL